MRRVILHLLKLKTMQKILQSLTSAILFTLCSFTISSAAVINIPIDYPTIQQAIDNANDFDTLIVQPGSYFENINFHGKKILLTSLFYLGNDTSYISGTIINGSNPVNADTGSCVIFSSGEDSSSVLQGFTITGGTGTKWLDAHGAGTYCEGGGILIDFSSPVIRFNRIINNVAVNVSGVSGAGGGGIRISDGNPQLLNNVIAFNLGRYGAGIVLNYTGCIIKNNLICYNAGAQNFNGGAAIWALSNLGTTPKIIENNTIYENRSSTGTGGILSWSTNVTLRNNIIWGNRSVNSSQILLAGGGTVSVTYSDIEGGYTGPGNINTDPLFSDTADFYLAAFSPCIDAGDSSGVYNDIENLAQPGFALWPAQGTIRNDMGAYGGQGSAVLGHGITTVIKNLPENNISLYIYPNPVTEKINFPDLKSSKLYLQIFNSTGVKVMEKHLNYDQGSLDVSSLQSGLYILKMKSDKFSISGKFVKQNKN